MKKLFSILVFACSVSLHIAQAQERLNFDSKPSNVTIYTMGATLVQYGSVNLKKGTNQIEFKGISAKADADRILLQFSGNAKVVALTEVSLELTALEQNIHYKSITDSLKLIQAQINETNDLISIYNKERDLFSSNMNIGGSNVGVQVVELQKMANLFRSRLTEIVHLLRKYQIQLDSLAGIRTALKVYKSKMENTFYKTNRLVKATVESEMATTEIYEFQHFVTDCGWAPFYDFKISDISKPVNLVYNAKMYNNTGIDWNNIQLVVSTADPSKSAMVPVLDPWRIDFESPTGQMYSSGRQSNWANKSKIQKNSNGYTTYDIITNSNRDEQKKFTTIDISQLSVDFEIAEKKTIPTDGKPYLVEMKQYTLKADYHYVAIPKLDAKAYLMASILDWDTLNLIEGPANVYMGKTYIGESYINPNIDGDTLEVSVGRDQKVVLKYEKKKEKSHKTFFSGNTVSNFTYEISIRNGNSKDVSINLFDQVPISANSEIVVDVTEISAADWNKDNGKLQWNINVKAGESVKYIISYSVKYPKNRPVKVKAERHKALYCPDF
ncbi:MAG: DUF4139 domain-containing protein [Bacteroidota bacterium]|nr:DUF4139 domain-containing protein [Bacteroidota bacterium]